MVAEKRYKVTVIGSLGKIVEVNAESCRSDDFDTLLYYVRIMYRHSQDPDYQKHLPKIVDRYSNQEYHIFEPESNHTESLPMGSF